MSPHGNKNLYIAVYSYVGNFKQVFRYFSNMVKKYLMWKVDL